MKKFTPRDYQLPMIQHIIDHKRCAVFCSLGGGKTVSTLTALDILSLTEDVFPALVLAPKRVAESVWPVEASEWDHLQHLRVRSLVSSNAAERLKALEHPADIYTLNYESVPWLVDHFGALWPFKTVIADESTRLKSFRLRQGGTRARALAKVAHTYVKRFVNLTGTPCPQGLTDLWGQQWLLDAGQRLEKTYSKYMTRYFRKDGFTTRLAHPDFADIIHEKLADICLTVNVEDYMDLRTPIVTNIYTDMPSIAVDMYRQMAKDLYVELREHTITAANAAVKSQKLLQLSNGALYLAPDVYCDEQPGAQKYEAIHDAKLDALESIYEESAGAPLLVSYAFRSDLARIKARFKFAVDIKDEGAIDKWNAGEIPMLLGHPASCSHGLNLQHGGNRLVFFGHSWSLENRLQIAERLGAVRQKQSGYDRPVFIYNIIAKGTLDEEVINRVHGKKSVQDALLKYLSNI